MSLFLLSKDPRVRQRINSQLKKGCISATSKEQFSKIQKQILTEPHPVIIIDETFIEQTTQIVSFLDYIVCTGVPGPKLFLISKQTRKTSVNMVKDNKVAVLSKPFTIDQIIASALELGGVASVKDHLTDKQLAQLQLSSKEEGLSSLLVGTSPAIQKIRTIIKRVGPSFNSVHIEGESGTGKEIVTNLLRSLSPCAHPFIPVNCSAIPLTLSDTYLFGHCKGAFTDAKEARVGLIKAVEGGVLFLDEIEDLSLTIQGKLLRLLEQKEYLPIGSDRIEKANFRLITASNQPLKKLVSKKRFREDLYNRLHHLTIHIPPLRERKEDLPALINFYLHHHGCEKQIDEQTMEKIMHYDWPGNVRELFNELEQMIYFSDDKKFLSYQAILTESALHT